MEELSTWYRTIHTEKNWVSIRIITDIEKNLGLVFVPESFDFARDSFGNVCMSNSPEVRDDYKDTFTPIDLLDYINALLHSSSYSEKYKEFSKIDFSMMPCPKNVLSFWKLVGLGGRLRQTPQSETQRLIRKIDQIKIG